MPIPGPPDEIDIPIPGLRPIPGLLPITPAPGPAGLRPIGAPPGGGGADITIPGLLPTETTLAPGLLQQSIAPELDVEDAELDAEFPPLPEELDAPDDEGGVAPDWWKAW